MKKLIALVGILLFWGSIAHAVYRYGLRPQQLQDKFSDYEYAVQGGTRTFGNPVSNLRANATFYGYATDYVVKMATTSDSVNSIANIWWTAGSSNTMVSSTFTFVGGDNTYQTTFAVPLDSPTIMNVSLTPGVTLFYQIGGMKRDIITGDTRIDQQ